jgi:hypothetical protein
VANDGKTKTGHGASAHRERLHANTCKKTFDGIFDGTLLNAKTYNSQTSHSASTIQGHLSSGLAEMQALCVSVMGHWRDTSKQKPRTSNPE